MMSKEEMKEKETDVHDEKKETKPKSSKSKTSKKDDEINALKEENQSLNDKLLRQFAEFDNYKKRTLKEKEELSAYAKAMCLQDILSVLDNFERALDSDCKDENFKKGMEMILVQFKDILKKQGVEEIEALNQPFDPELHNAINQVEDENFGENTVCQVFQKGYKLGNRVIRHAMVVVANP